LIFNFNIAINIPLQDVHKSLSSLTSVLHLDSLQIRQHARPINLPGLGGVAAGDGSKVLAIAFDIWYVHVWAAIINGD
jgi:hypothetical protein